jgi:Arm DNA-binding domain
MYADGNGLYLHIGSGGKSWIFRYQIEGRRRDMGLGSVDLVSLAEARDRILDLRRSIRNGADPLETKRQENANRRALRVKALTFADAAAAYIAAHEAGWADQRSWPSTMRLYVNPVIGDLPVAAIDLPAVLRTHLVIQDREREACAWPHRIGTRLGNGAGPSFRREPGSLARAPREPTR